MSLCPDRVTKNSNLMEIKIESPNFLEETVSVPPKLLESYQRMFNRFNKWSSENGFKDYDESTVLAFFKHQASIPSFKPNSLWSYYYMLKSVLISNYCIDISEYRTLRNYLTKKTKGWRPIKAPGLTGNEFLNFIHGAPDGKYLAMKVLFIIGVFGQCNRDELNNLHVQDVEDLGTMLHVKVVDNNHTRNRTFTIGDAHFIAICRKYIALRPPLMDNPKFFIKYMNGKCCKIPMGINKIGGIPKEVARYLNLPNWKDFTGHCFKRTSYLVTGKVDPDGN
ncbi:uncharacterized protein [Euwallacea fornicatus]|uniref:uncharacterized protein n=1 Tax=Euwallacea fornicatus TaxID=995702 RepID=UPI00338E98D9